MVNADGQRVFDDAARSVETYGEAVDPLEAALAAVPLDDEPYTDEERVRSEAGWQEFLCGESSPLDEVFALLRDEESIDGASAVRTRSVSSERKRDR